jgi:mono/diheme cytochrome c family protein
MKRIILLVGAVVILAGCSNTLTYLGHKLLPADRCLTDLEPWESGKDRRNFAQCWDRVDLLRFYNMSQGSHLVPYRLVAPLMLAKTKQTDPDKLEITDIPFLHKSNIEERWKFLLLEESDLAIKKSELSVHTITRSYLTRNTDLPPEWWVGKEGDGSARPAASDPELVQELTEQGKKDIKRGWPVGFTVDKRTSGNRAWQGEWLGANCAACHTAQVEYKDGKGKELRYRVSGGPAMADVHRFLEDLRNSLVALQQDAEKSGSWFKKYLADYTDRFREVDEKELRVTLRTAVENLESWHERNAPSVPAGYARLDAFGDIYNDVLHLLRAEPENRRTSNAPVSYPFLWDTSHHNRTQWSGFSPPIPIGRNVGQVLGVFGKVDFEVGWFDDTTTINFNNLEVLQNLVEKLRSPKWPETFGKTKPGLVAAGKQLFERYCQSCHVEQKRDEPLWYVNMAMVPVEKIRTDPLMAENTSRRVAVTPDDKNRVQVVNDLVGGVTLETLLSMRPFTLLRDAAVNCGFNFWPWDCALSHFEAYKGRPLDGIWATAPYLHNGSVPTLYDLLKPPHERPTGFCVGSRQFDPAHVGFETLLDPDPAKRDYKKSQQECESRGWHWLDTSLPGNSNSGHHGHKYGGDLSEEEIWQLVEYMKDL